MKESKEKSKTEYLKEGYKGIKFIVFGLLRINNSKGLFILA